MVRVAEAVICIILLFSFTLVLYNFVSSAEMQGERPQSPLEAATDKVNYYSGEVVKIDGRVPELTDGREVNIIVKDANGETFTKLKAKPTSDNSFTASFQIPLFNKLFHVGKWTINIGYAIWATRVDINVFGAEKAAIYSVTISKPELVITPPFTMNIRVGEDVMIVSEVKNLAEKDQRVFYIVKIRDELGTTVFLNWSSGALKTNETAKFSVTWMPELEGKYRLDTFVWDDISKPTPLSPSQNVSLTVAR